MSIAAALAAIEGHAVTAGAAVTPPMGDVCAGVPLPRGRCARVYWDGEADAVRMPGRFTLASELVGDRLAVRAFWPIASADEAAHAGRVAEMADFAHAFRAAVDGDSGIEADVAHAEADFAQIGGALYAVVDILVTVTTREVAMA